MQLAAERCAAADFFRFSFGCPVNCVCDFPCSPLLCLTSPSRRVWPTWSLLARVTAGAVDDGAAAAVRGVDQEAAAAEAAAMAVDSSTISNPLLRSDLSAPASTTCTGLSFYIASHRSLISQASFTSHRTLHRIASPLAHSHAHFSRRIASHLHRHHVAFAHVHSSLRAIKLCFQSLNFAPSMMSPKWTAAQRSRSLDLSRQLAINRDCCRRVQQISKAE